MSILSIITSDTYRMFNNMVLIKPNEILKLFSKNFNLEDVIDYIMEFDIDEIKDIYS